MTPQQDGVMQQGKPDDCVTYDALACGPRNGLLRAAARFSPTPAQRTSGPRSGTLTFAYDSWIGGRSLPRTQNPPLSLRIDLSQD